MTHHVLQVALGPFVEQHMIVVFRFLQIPDIKRFHHHHHTHLVAELNKFWRRHVVRGADGIATHVFEQANLMANSAFMHGCSECAEVVVEAHALKLTDRVVEEKSAARIVFNLADTEGLLIGLAPVDANLGRVEVRMFG